MESRTIKTHRLYFIRRFTQGGLRGLIHHDSITFPSPRSCIAWVRAINAKAAAGKLDYEIIDYSFQNFTR